MFEPLRFFPRAAAPALQNNTDAPFRYTALAEVGCAKVASANVETVFSGAHGGAGRISIKSGTLDPQILSDYAFLHYNYKYEWLRPTLDEIVAAYKKLYGKDARAEDYEADACSDEEGAEEAEEGGEKRTRRTQRRKRRIER